MTIHHDKMAYGRLAKTKEDLSEDKLMEMAKLLSEFPDYEYDDNMLENEEMKSKNKENN